MSVRAKPKRCLLEHLDLGEDVATLLLPVCSVQIQASMLIHCDYSLLQEIIHFKIDLYLKERNL